MLLGTSLKHARPLCQRIRNFFSSRRLDKAEAERDAADEILKTLGHELRQPLTVCLAELDLLLIEPHAESCRPSLLAIRAHLQREAQSIVHLMDRLGVPVAVSQPVCVVGPLAAAAMKPRILLVEDHVDTRDVFTRLLWREGYRVKAVGKVADAIKEARPNDFLICDLGLPDGDGCEVMRAVAPMGVYGIAVSGSGLRDDQERALKAGFANCITKPFDIKAVIDAISLHTKTTVR